VIIYSDVKNKRYSGDDAFVTMKQRF